MENRVKFCIMDPTGNITALVVSNTAVQKQSEVAERIMRRHPEVEQVGFVTLPERPQKAQHTDNAGAGNETDIRLRMAGGEFCGNASMSAAALACLILQEDYSENAFAGQSSEDMTKLDPHAYPLQVTLQVSGAAAQVRVCLQRTGRESFRAGVCMPPAVSVTRRTFCFGADSGELPVVAMEGISHIIIEQDSDFYHLITKPEKTAAAAKAWCDALAADGLGLMFLEQSGTNNRLTPFVYIPGSNTAVWEHSCASGSSAVGMYAAARVDSAGETNVENVPGAIDISNAECAAGAAEDDGAVHLALQEPGGTLHASSRPGGETWLYGKVHLVKWLEEEF